jgi:two-component system, cell cycle sensor histidine kinase and response regulator CckA
MKEPGRILVVDDDPGVGQMLTKALARHGFVVDAVVSADEALRRIEDASYDAALVDLVMPGLDGADLSEILRRRFPGLPIGMLTGYTNSPLIPSFERSGMAVFKKPVLIQDLVDFLQREIG